MPDNLSPADLGLLNDAIDALTRVATGPDRGKLQELLTTSEPATEELHRLLPPGAFHLLITLTSPAAFHDLLSAVPATEYAKLKQARQLAHEHLAPLLDHPALVAIMKSIMQSGPRHEVPQADLPSNRVTNITFAPFFVGHPPKLTPALRIAFITDGNRIAYDGLMTWRDLLQLAGSFLKLVAEDFQRVTPLAKPGMINPALWPFLKSAVQALRADLTRIEEATVVHEKLSPLPPPAEPPQSNPAST